MSPLSRSSGRDFHGYDAAAPSRCADPPKDSWLETHTARSTPFPPADTSWRGRHPALRQIFKVCTHLFSSIQTTRDLIPMEGDKPPHPFKIGRFRAIRIMSRADFCLERFRKRRKSPFHLAGKNIVAKFASFRDYGLAIGRGMQCFIRGVTGQEHLVENLQSMVGLPDLPVGNAWTFAPSLPERPEYLFPIYLVYAFPARTCKGLCPSHIKGRTVRAYPVLLRAGPVCIPEFLGLKVLGNIMALLLILLDC